MSVFSKSIQQLNLTSVMQRLERDGKLTGEGLATAETQYRQFLQLSLEDTATIPTALADMVWHYHILDTKKYAADCDTIFGSFMHHNPQLKATKGFTEKAQKSRDVWLSRFGEDALEAQATALCNRVHSALCNR